MEKIRLREARLTTLLSPEPPTESFFYRPYLADEQTLMILDLLERLKPKKCFEWGAGWSTVFFPRFVPDAKWIAFEHSMEFVELVTPFLPPNAVVLHRQLWSDYVDSVASFVVDQPFDFVFIDGERRIECVKMALGILREGGIVVKHDSGGQDEFENVKRFYYLGEEDVRAGYEEQGTVASLWWGRK